MKRIAIVLSFVLLLAACGGSGTVAGPAVSTANGVVADNPPVHTAPAAAYAKDLQDLLDKTQKIKSYSFYYIDSTTQLQADRWYVKGDKARIELYQPNYWNANEWVDTAYVDFTQHTAAGYCENWQQIRCVDNNRQFNLVFSPFDKKLPMYWLTQIPPSAKVVSSESIDQRFVTKVQWTDGSTTYSLLLDNTFGLPIKVKVEGQGEPQEYYFKQMAFNAVKDEMLSHAYVKRG